MCLSFLHAGHITQYLQASLSLLLGQLLNFILTTNKITSQFLRQLLFISPEYCTNKVPNDYSSIGNTPNYHINRIREISIDAWRSWLKSKPHSRRGARSRFRSCSTVMWRMVHSASSGNLIGREGYVSE